MRRLSFFLTLLITFAPELAANRHCPTPRDFNAPLTAQDRQDIRYIVLTLAANNPLSVIPYANALNHAGDRIGPVHPLPFLECIFTDEEMKVGIRNLKKQNGKLWREFMDGLSGSLSEERERGNLTDKMVDEFAQRVNSDVRMLQTLVAGYRWYDLVNTLIAQTPRQGNYGRYDM